jgi:hypothetical protein
VSCFNLSAGIILAAEKPLYSQFLEYLPEKLLGDEPLFRIRVAGSKGNNKKSGAAALTKQQHRKALP